MDGESQKFGSDMSPHLPLLYLLGREADGHVVETGVGGGWSTIALLLACHDRGKILNSYDIWEAVRDMASRAFKYAGIGPDDPRRGSWRLTITKGCNGAADFADGSVGLLFIDSNHRYEFVKEELAAWLPKMDKRGIICGHDYYPATEEERSTYGVARAVDELVFANPDRFRLQVSPYSWGFYILWPK